MRNFFKLMGLLTLFVFSFYYTEHTVTVVRDMDDLMIELKQRSSSYQIPACNATIKEETIIPGISGKTVDINKSYVKMKEYGKFNENLLIYQKILPDKVLADNKDKFIISGNKDKRMVSLIFLVQDHDNIDKIVKILKEKRIGATFFLDGDYVESHLDSLETLVKSGHTLGNYSYHQDYSNSSFVWINTMFTRLGGQKENYCITESSQKKVLDICRLYQNYTIVPNIVVKDTPLVTIKKEVSSGSLIALPVNKVVEDELPSIITYLEGRGYLLANLDTHLEE